MTLIVAVPATDGVVFASDQQVTSGEVRHAARKIYRLSDRCLWAGAGELAVIQRVEEQLRTLPQREQPLNAIRDALGIAVKTAVTQLLQLDFRTPLIPQTPDSLLSLHPADFLFVEHREHGPRILHVLINGTSEWIDGRFAAAGNGDLFAHALLKKYAGCALSCRRAKLLAFKVIEEAIEVGAYGLGQPIDIWEVGPDGARQAMDEERLALADAARLLREREIGMLTNHGVEGDSA